MNGKPYAGVVRPWHKNDTIEYGEFLQQL
jgi:hypothetical protein